jgi:hypothetical protein
MSSSFIFLDNVSQSKAHRLTRWFRLHRAMLSYYDVETRQLRVLITKHGEESTRAQLAAAIEATR